MSELRIKNHPIRIGRFFKDLVSSPRSSQTPFVYQRSPHERYTFEGGEILLNSLNVESLIDSGVDISLWVGLASAIEEFRKEVWAKCGNQYGEFNARAQAVLDKILGKMTRVYEEVTGGLRLQILGGKVWINNIDARAVLVLFLARPDEKRRRYLASVALKLGLILEGRTGNSLNGHGESVRKLYQEIQEALSETAHSLDRPFLTASSHPGA